MGKFGIMFWVVIVIWTILIVNNIVKRDLALAMLQAAVVMVIVAKEFETAKR